MSKRSPPARYQDEPDGDAVSMHTTPDDYQYDDDPELPSYSDSEAAAATSSTQHPEQTSPALETHIAPRDPYQTLRSESLHTSGGKAQNLNEITIRMEPQLTDPTELHEYIKNYISLIPPSPRVRILGSHPKTRYDSSKKKSEKERVVDFDISFRLQHHLKRDADFWQPCVAENSDKTYRGRCRKTRASGYGQDIEVGSEIKRTLQDWCRDYCASKAALKVFRVTRELEGFSPSVIQKHIESYIRSTHYHGHVDISFPLEEKHVDIYSPHWVNRARIGWVRYLFYFTFLWLITWPVLYLMTKWWAVYRVRWRWSREERGGRRVWASVSEEQWVVERRNLIQLLVLERHHGDATGFAVDVPEERVQRAMRGKTPSTGNANVDAAVGFVQGGVGLWNAVQGRGNVDPRVWGEDS